MRIGVEVEFTGVKRTDLAVALASESFVEDLWCKMTEEVNPPYLRHWLNMNHSGKWRLLRDRSISPEVMVKGVLEVLPEEDISREQYMCELVSPVMESTDLGDLNILASYIRNMGGIVNETCGVHIHVDMLTMGELKRLVRLINDSTEELYEMWGVQPWRQEKYCKPIDPIVVRTIEDFADDTDVIFAVSQLAKLVAPDVDVKSATHPMRYSLLNLHSLLIHKTVEFRFFNSTLSTEMLHTYVLWVEDVIAKVSDNAFKF